jgi:hypothetical protein
MRPERRLAEPGSSVGWGFVELRVALVAIGLEDAAGLAEMPANVLVLPVRGV